MIRRYFALGTAAMTIALCPAQADEVYVGASGHAVDTPLSLESGEGGADIQAGYRTSPIKGLEAIGSPSAYLHVQASLDNRTNVAAAGLSWKFGDTLYVRPGFGLAVHDDTIPEVGPGGKRIDLGSRILFEPELAVGYRIDPRFAVEASWVHISHATLLAGQNPGMDFIGARLVISLD